MPNKEERNVQVLQEADRKPGDKVEDQPEAEKRVTEAFAEANRAVKEAADKARRAAVLTGFVTAASLVVSLGAAWWAALRGGHHRDNQIPARFPVGAHRRLS